MRRLLIALVALVALIGAALASLPYLVSSDWIRDRVVAEVERASGLRLALDGPVSLGIIPSLALEASDVGLSLAGGEEFVRVGELRFALAFGPLLERRVEITGLTLVRPKVTVTMDLDGRPTLLPPPSAAEPTAPEDTGAPAEATDGASGTPDIRIRKIAIEDGTLLYSDPAGGQRHEITALDLSTAVEGLDQPLSLTGAMAWNGLAVSLSMSTGSPAELMAGSAVPVTMAVSGTGFSLRTEGRLDPSAATLFAGPLSLRLDDLPALAKALAVDTPPVRSLALDGQFATGSGRTELTEARFAIDGLTGTGEVGFAAGERPRVDARARIEALDLDRLPGGGETPASPDAGTEGDAAPLPDLGALADVDIGIDLSIGTVSGQRLGAASPLADLRLVAVADSGRVTIALEDVAVAGGTIGGVVRLAQGEAGLAAEGEIRARGFKVETLADIAGTQSLPLSGGLGADIGFASAGRTITELVAGLRTTGAATLRAGRFTGLGLAEAIGDPAADRLEDLSIDASLDRPGSPLKLVGKAAFRGKPLDFEVSLNPEELIAGKALSLSAVLRTARLGLSFEGSVDPHGKAVAGAFKATSPSLASAFALLGRKAGDLPEGAVSIAGKLKASPQSVSITGGDYVLGETHVAGAVGVTLGTRPRLTADLSGEAIDLGALIGGAAGAGDVKGPEKGNAKRAWSADKIDLGGLSTFDADLRARVSALKFGKIRTRNVDLSLAIAGGRLEASLNGISLYKGSGTARVILDSARENHPVSIVATVKGVEAKPFLAATSGVDQIEGTADVSVDLAGEAVSLRRLMTTLGGNATLDVADGMIHGIDVPALLTSVLSALAESAEENPKARTPFKKLHASFVIKDGVARNDDMELRSAKLAITGKGTIDIGRKRVDYRVESGLSKKEDRKHLFNLEVPVMIEGTWEKPRIYPELGGIIGDIVNDPGKTGSKDKKKDKKKDKETKPKKKKKPPEGLSPEEEARWLQENQ